MAGLPQSFMIFREELRKEKLEKERLTKEYQCEIADLNKEMQLLKEKLHAQQDMMRIMTEYVEKVENQLIDLNSKVEENDKRSYH